MGRRDERSLRQCATRLLTVRPTDGENRRATALALGRANQQGDPCGATGDVVYSCSGSGDGAGPARQQSALPRSGAGSEGDRLALGMGTDQAVEPTGAAMTSATENPLPESHGPLRFCITMVSNGEATGGHKVFGRGLPKALDVEVDCGPVGEAVRARPARADKPGAVVPNSMYRLVIAIRWGKPIETATIPNDFNERQGNSNERPLRENRGSVLLIVARRRGVLALGATPCRIS